MRRGNAARTARLFNVTMRPPDADSSYPGGRGRNRSADRHAACHGLDVLGGEGLAADAPVAAGDLLDDAPGHGAHVLALDADHGVGQLAHDVLLLLGGEDALDELDVDERHGRSPSVVEGPESEAISTLRSAGGRPHRCYPPGTP